METTPLRACCFSGHIHEGAPTGRDIQLGGVNCYIAEPQNENKNNNAIIIATDIFGYKLTNTRLLADEMAKKGFIVVVPDLFNGNALKGEIMEKMVAMLGISKPKYNNFFLNFCSKIWNFLTIAPTALFFMLRYATPKKQQLAIPIFDRVIDDLRTNFQINKIGMTGYCYGVYYCLHYAKQNNDLVSAVATAHGRIRVPDDIDPLIKPTLFIGTDNDHAFSKASFDKTKEILSKRNDSNNFEFKFYPGTYHGFAIRGEVSNPQIEEAKTDALNLTLSFFLRHLSSDDDDDDDDGEKDEIIEIHDN